jgi:hypothetical protein
MLLVCACLLRIAKRHFAGLVRIARRRRQNALETPDAAGLVDTAAFVE